MNTTWSLAAAALALALAAPAGASAQGILDRDDGILSDHPAERNGGLSDRGSYRSPDTPGRDDTADRDVVPELDPLRDLDEPLSPRTNTNRDRPTILDEIGRDDDGPPG